MTDAFLLEVLRLAVGVGACFSIPFVAELGIRLARYVAERRALLDRVDALIEFSRQKRRAPHA